MTSQHKGKFTWGVGPDKVRGITAGFESWDSMRLEREADALAFSLTLDSISFPSLLLSPSTPRLRPIVSQVCVAGNFNNWSDTATPLHKQADGSFAADVPLPWGEKQPFKYVVDGGGSRRLASESVGEYR